MQAALWTLITSTDLVSKAILLILLGMSIICWALAWYKFMELRAKRKSIAFAQSLLPNIKGMDDLLARIAVIQTTYAGELLTQFLTDFKKLLRIYEPSHGAASDKDWYLFQASVYQRVDEALTEEESLLPVLSTFAAAAPLIGLFGTVWGLIHAFMGIAQQRSADIAAVAPGIAEALFTTLGGLIVAIPALALYAYLHAKVKSLEQEIGELADSTLWILRTILPTDFVKPAVVQKRAQPGLEQESL